MPKKITVQQINKTSKEYMKNYTCMICTATQYNQTTDLHGQKIKLSYLTELITIDLMNQRKLTITVTNRDAENRITEKYAYEK